MRKLLSSFFAMALVITTVSNVYAYTMLIGPDTTVYANKEYNNSVLAINSIDNNLSTWWQGEWWGSSERPQWLVIDLGQEYYVDEIDLYFSLQSYPGATGEPDMMYDIYTSIDGIAWDLIAETETSLFHGTLQESSGASTGSGPLYLPDDYRDNLTIDESLQYLKFDVVGGWEFAHLNEIEVWGEAAPVPEPATLILLGTGLIGLAGLGRKRMVK